MKDFHIFIKRYRLVYIAQLLFVNYLAWSMWTWYESNAEAMELAASGAFGAAFLACLGMVKYGLEGLRQDSGHD